MIVKVLARRIKDGHLKGKPGKGPNARLSTSNLATIAILPINSNTQVKEFACGLAKALRKHGPTLLINRAFLVQFFGEDVVKGLNQHFHRSRVTAWIARKEEDYRFIILQVIFNKVQN